MKVILRRDDSPSHYKRKKISMFVLYHLICSGIPLSLVFALVNDGGESCCLGGEFVRGRESEKGRE